MNWCNSVGSQKDLGQTNFPALDAANGKGLKSKGKRNNNGLVEPRTTGDPILDTNNSTVGMIPANGSETVV
jgi:hypothetical protein